MATRAGNGQRIQNLADWSERQLRNLQRRQAQVKANHDERIAGIETAIADYNALPWWKRMFSRIGG